MGVSSLFFRYIPWRQNTVSHNLHLPALNRLVRLCCCVWEL